MASPAADAYGVDVDSSFGVPRRWNLCSGTRNVGNALARRFSTTRGSLKADRNYGLNLRRYLQGGITSARLSQLRSACTAEAQKEETVQSVTSIDISYSTATQTLTVGIVVMLDTGPFTLVLAVTALSVQILRQGQGVLSTASAAGAAAASIVAVVGGGQAGAAGGPGAAGPPGPAGPAGSGAPIITLPSTEEEHSSTGAEELIGAFVFSVDTGLLSGSTLSVSAVLQAKTASGTMTVTLRFGGSYTGLDGTIIDSQTVNATSYVDVKLSGTITNPTGQVPVKITITSAGPAVDAAVNAPTVSVSG